MTIKELLTSKNISKVLIVDDGFDPAPRVSDLENKRDEWSNFFADLVGEKLAIVKTEFPDYETISADRLRTNEDFVAMLWRIKTQLGAPLSNLLFEQYEQSTATDLKFLNKLASDFESLELEVVRAGRDIPEDGKNANIIFADLFLGSSQGDDDIKLSINKIKSIIKGRESEPPIVFLMSSSNRLTEKSPEFRDGAKLLGAMFRCFNKKDLEDQPTLERAISRMVLNQEDGVRIAKFLHAWESGLNKAELEFLKAIRRIDLPDYAQIQQVLLDYEGQPLGSYILDVFDSMLQHQIEGDDATIETANELNKINSEVYPSRHLTDSPDLQELVYKTSFQNPKRLTIKNNDCGTPVSFGDILVHQSYLEVNTKPKNANESDVLIVLSPACDLVRPGAKRVLLLGGTISELKPKDWSYSSNKSKTPIIMLNGNNRMSIDWDLKDFQSWKIEDLNKCLEVDYKKIVRMREITTLELQQKLLSDMGRVGVMAKLPANYDALVEVFTFDTNGAPKKLDLPKLAKTGGICFIGRDEDSKSQTRLVLNEQVVDELLAAVQSLAESALPTRAKDTLIRLKASTTFINILDRGLKLLDWKEISEFKVPNADSTKPAEIIGLIVRNPKKPISNLGTNQQKSGTILIVITDIPVTESEAIASNLTEQSPVLPEASVEVTCKVANIEVEIAPVAMIMETQPEAAAKKNDIGS